MRHIPEHRGLTMKNKKHMCSLLGMLAAAVFIVLAVYGVCSLVTSRSSKAEAQTDTSEYIVVGFSQLGAESDWRSANTQSMVETFTEENGYKLIVEDGQQKQSNQIMAVRTFIQQEVDYIVLAPVTETGWDTVLQEAKDAGIPVIIVDRRVDVEDESLFTCWVGSDFELESKKAAEWLNQFTIKEGIEPEDIHIVNIQGTIGASAQIGRTKGLEDAIKKYGWTHLSQAMGDFTQAKGKEAMSSLLKRYDDINVVYCENDNEALGAIEAIEEAGKKAGSDIKNGEIMVISFDGVNEQAMNYVLNDKITCIAECNPLHGPRVRAIIESLEAGITPDKYSYVDEKIYSAYDKIYTLSIDNSNYDVTILSQEEMN
jgi:simple sugar transport system substrate-binding protein